MGLEKLDKQAIRKLREQMVDEGIAIVATGYFEYNGKMRELLLTLRSEDCAKPSQRTGTEVHDGVCGESCSTCDEGGEGK